MHHDLLVEPAAAPGNGRCSPPRWANSALAGWCGFVFGSLGALVLALHLSWSGWGWVAFLASNVAWLVHAHATGTRSLLLQQLVFMCTTFIGLWRWLS